MSSIELTVNAPTTLVRKNLCSTSARGNRLYLGTWTAGGISREVAIKVVDGAGEYVEFPELTILAASHPNLMSTLCTHRHGTELWIVGELARYNLLTFVDSGIGEDKVPMHQVWSQALSAIRSLHDANLSFGLVTAKNLLFRQVDGRFVLCLYGYQTVTRLSDTIFADLAMKNEIYQLVSALYTFKASRPVGPRDFELSHLYRRHRKIPTRTIMTHPSLAPDCKIAAFMIAVAEYLMVEVRSHIHPLVDALEIHGRNCHDPVAGRNPHYYEEWWMKFPAALRGIHYGRPALNRDGLPLPANALSDPNTLQHCIKCFRNRLVHRHDGVDQRMEDALGTTTLDFVRIWRLHVGRLFCDTWTVVASHFPCMFDE